MDFFDNSNWFLTKFLLSCFGAWPFQSPHCRLILRSFVITVLLSILIPEILKLITSKNNVDLAIECVPMLALHLLTLVKMSNCYLKTELSRALLIAIQRDWHNNLSSRDKRILHRNGNNNRKITHAYIYYIYATTLMYLAGPMVPKIMDLIVPLNASRPALVLYPTEYFVDPVKNEVPLLIHAYSISPFPSTIIVAFDALYCNCVSHACSMFEIVGKRLEDTAGKSNRVEQENDKLTKAKIHNSIRQCIEQHQRSLKFAELLQSIYSQCLLNIVLINTAALSITGYQVVVKMGNTSEILRYGTFSIGQIVHLFFLSLPAQKLTNHSQRIHLLTYQGYWYTIPIKSKKLLILIMMRSRKPCILTAGKLYVMSSQSFAMVVQKSMSYFTVLLSMR